MDDDDNISVNSKHEETNESIHFYFKHLVYLNGFDNKDEIVLLETSMKYSKDSKNDPGYSSGVPLALGLVPARNV